MMYGVAVRRNFKARHRLDRRLFGVGKTSCTRIIMRLEVQPRGGAAGMDMATSST